MGAVTRTDEAGLFGPDSVSWRVQADPAAGVGGLSALFLQALHPLAMAGVLSTPASTPIFGRGLPAPRSTSPR